MNRQILCIALLTLTSRAITIEAATEAETGEETTRATPSLVVNRPLPTRQIHLDFHTSEHIADIGKQFSKEQFQSALKMGRVNSINIFAKGHHGWNYYPSKIGKVHPNLDFDLLGAQVEACHEIGVECPFYFTVGWSVHDAETHPECCVRRKDGSFEWKGNSKAKPEDPFPSFTWKLLCPSGEYHKQIKKQVVELCKAYDVDGFWFDIYMARHGCHCEQCHARMKKNGVDPDDQDAVITNFVEVYKEHMADLRATIAKYHPQATVFFNGTTALRGVNQSQSVYEYNTHQDLEDLPTGWGGYDKFPLRSQYYLDRGYQICAMSGKFHTSWGEFGGFKHPDALKFEAASMIAFGAACNFGDQLHPSGRMDMQTYKNIGEAFDYVEQIEEYGPGGKPVANLGLWFTNDIETDQGTAKLLMDMQAVYRIATKENLTGLQTLVVPSKPTLDEEDVAAIQKFVDQGGAVIFLAHGVMSKDWSRFLFDVGADFVGHAQYDIDYTEVDPILGEELMQSPVLNYIPALRTKPKEGTTVLAAIYEPYFSRTYEHFCSHQNTPPRPEKSAHPALIQKGKVLFVANPIDRMYYRRAARAHRDLFEAALGRVHTQPSLKVELPSAGRVNLLHQPDKKRYVAHLLYATPHFRGKLELIEDLVPLHDVAVELRVPAKIKSAHLIPGDISLPLREEAGAVYVSVPKFTMHCCIVFQY